MEEKEGKYSVSYNSQYLPLIIALSIVLGLTVFIVATGYFFSCTKQFNNKAKEERAERRIILNSGNSADTISVRPLSQGGVIVTNESVLKGRKQKLFINLHKSALKWIVYHSIVLSLAWSSMIFVLLLIYQIKKEFEIKIRSTESAKVIVPFLVVLIAVIVSIKYVGAERDILMSGNDMMEYFEIVFERPQNTVETLVNLLSVVALAPLTGIVLINIAMQKTVLMDGKASGKVQLEKYRRLKDRLNIFALYAGLFVATSIIGTELQREMIKEQVTNIDLIYPDELIFAYGAAFTLFLALFFLPTYISLKFYNKRVDFEENNTGEGVKWWEIGRESIDDIKLTFSIILPLLSGFFQNLFNQ